MHLLCRILGCVMVTLWVVSVPSVSACLPLIGLSVSSNYTLSECTGTPNLLNAFIRSGGTRLLITNSAFTEITLWYLFESEASIEFVNVTFRTLSINGLRSKTVLLENCVVDGTGALPVNAEVSLTKFENAVDSSITMRNVSITASEISQTLVAVNFAQVMNRTSVLMDNVNIDLVDIPGWQMMLVQFANLVDSTFQVTRSNMTGIDLGIGECIALEQSTDSSVKVASSSFNGSKILRTGISSNLTVEILDAHMAMHLPPTMGGTEIEGIEIGASSSTVSVTVSRSTFVAAALRVAFVSFFGSHHSIAVNDTSVHLDAACDGLAMLSSRGGSNTTIAFTNSSIGHRSGQTTAKELDLLRFDRGSTTDVSTDLNVTFTHTNITAVVSSFGIVDALREDATASGVELNVDGGSKWVIVSSGRIDGLHRSDGNGDEPPFANMSLVFRDADLDLRSTGGPVSFLTNPAVDFRLAAENTRLTLRGQTANLTNFVGNEGTNGTSITLVNSALVLEATNASASAAVIYADSVNLDGLHLHMDSSAITVVSAQGPAHIVRIAGGSTIANFMLTSVGECSVVTRAEADSSPFILEQPTNATFKFNGIVMSPEVMVGSTTTFPHMAIVKVVGEWRGLGVAFQRSLITMTRAALSTSTVRFEQVPTTFVGEDLSISLSNTTLSLMPTPLGLDIDRVYSITDLRSVKGARTTIIIEYSTIVTTGRFAGLTVASGHSNLNWTLLNSTVAVASSAPVASSLAVFAGCDSSTVLIEQSNLTLHSSESGIQATGVAFQWSANSTVEFMDSTIMISSVANAMVLLMYDNDASLMLRMQGSTMVTNGVGIETALLVIQKTKVLGLVNIFVHSSSIVSLIAIEVQGSNLTVPVTNLHAEITDVLLPATVSSGTSPPFLLLYLEHISLFSLRNVTKVATAGGSVIGVGLSSVNGGALSIQQFFVNVVGATAFSQLLSLEQMEGSRNLTIAVRDSAIVSENGGAVLASLTTQVTTDSQFSFSNCSVTTNPESALGHYVVGVMSTSTLIGTSLSVSGTLVESTRGSAQSFAVLSLRGNCDVTSAITFENNSVVIPNGTSFTSVTLLHTSSGTVEAPIAFRGGDLLVDSALTKLVLVADLSSSGDSSLELSGGVSVQLRQMSCEGDALVSLVLARKPTAFDNVNIVVQDVSVSVGNPDVADVGCNSQNAILFSVVGEGLKRPVLSLERVSWRSALGSEDITGSLYIVGLSNTSQAIVLLSSVDVEVKTKPSGVQSSMLVGEKGAELTNLQIARSSFTGLTSTVSFLTPTAAVVSDARINCSWWNGRRLEARHFPAVEQSAVSYWPTSLEEQKQTVCPQSATPTPSLSTSTTASMTQDSLKSDTPPVPHHAATDVTSYTKSRDFTRTPSVGEQTHTVPVPSVRESTTPPLLRATTVQLPQTPSNSNSSSNTEPVPPTPTSSVSLSLDCAEPIAIRWNITSVDAKAFRDAGGQFWIGGVVEWNTTEGDAPGRLGILNGSSSAVIQEAALRRHVRVGISSSDALNGNAPIATSIQSNAELNTVGIHVTLKDASKAGLDLIPVGRGGVELTVELIVTPSPELFPCPTIRAETFSTHVALTAPPPLVSAATTKAIQTTVITTALVGGVLSNPSAGLMQARSTAISGLLECRFAHSEPLPPTTSPFGWRFGNASGGYYRGAVVGNLAFVMLMAFLAGVLVIIFRCATSGRLSNWNVMATLHLPGVLIVPVAEVLQGSAESATALLSHPRDGGDIPLGCFAHVTIASVVGLLAWKTTAGLHSIVVPRQQLAGQRPSMAAPLDLLRWFITWMFLSTQKWIDDPNKAELSAGFKAHWQQLYTDYAAGRAWYLGVEMTISIVIGILSGITREELCETISIAMLALLAVQTFGAIVLRPYKAPFERGFHITLSVLTLLGALFVVMAAQLNSAGLAHAAEVISLVILILSMLKLLLDVLHAMRWFYSRYQKWQRRRGLAKCVQDVEDSPLNRSGHTITPSEQLLESLFAAIDRLTGNTYRRESSEHQYVGSSELTEVGVAASTSTSRLLVPVERREEGIGKPHHALHLPLLPESPRDQEDVERLNAPLLPPEQDKQVTMPRIGHNPSRDSSPPGRPSTRTQRAASPVPSQRLRDNIADLHSRNHHRHREPRNKLKIGGAELALLRIAVDRCERENRRGEATLNHVDQCIYDFDRSCAAFSPASALSPASSSPAFSTTPAWMSPSRYPSSPRRSLVVAELDNVLQDCMNSSQQM